MTTTVPVDLPMAGPDGESRQLGDVLTAPLTIVQLVRYFGCLPCQDWLVELDRRADELADRGVGAVAIGGSADYQAQWLRDEKGVTIPLLLDPEHTIRPHVDAMEPLGMKMLNPKGAAAYARSLRRGYKPQKVTKDTVRSPGVVALEKDGTVRKSWIGARIGDYPPLDQVLAELDA